MKDDQKLALLQDAVTLMTQGFGVVWLRDESGQLVGFQVTLEAPREAPVTARDPR